MSSNLLKLWVKVFSRFRLCVILGKIIQIILKGGMDNLTLSIEDLFDEVSDRARNEGAFSREEWNDTIEDVLEEKRDVAEMDDDDNFQYVLESLQARFDDFSQNVTRM